MTEYELLDAINSSRANAIAASMAFVTISSAYAVVIHLVGRKIARFFIWAFALGYSLYAVLPILGNFTSVNESALLRAQLAALRAGLPVPAQVPPVYVSSLILLYIWLLCMVYTVYVRRSDRWRGHTAK
ncbi:MAG: hypothetical protein PVI46_13730 [Lysobacterales bacterium]|jgi:hypothetical protein